MACDDATETWMPIPEFVGYEASNTGQIRGPRGVILSPAIHPRGYLIVSLWRRENGLRVRRSRTVHRLVAAAFFGPCPKGLEVNHKDGNKLNGRIDNLEYVSKGANEHHAHVTGLKSHRGTRNPATRLTDEDVVRIRQRYANGERQPSIAKSFGISQPAVSLIVSRKNWSHVA